MQTNAYIHHAQEFVLTSMAGCAVSISLILSPCAQATELQPVEPVYFGNGCFWGRQYDFVKTEESMGRDITAVVGYAGGRGQSDKVCYYYTPEASTVYERLGHAEVVQVQLEGQNDTKQDQFRQFAKTYFAEFNKMRNGKMQRQDPQDAGAGYRNVVGLPGGVNSPLYQILKEENVNNMQLLEGSGNMYKGVNPTEGDVLNTVWVYDSNMLPFHQAEVYHQFHNGLGKFFPPSYTKDLKSSAIEKGMIKETGCPEYFFLGS